MALVTLTLIALTLLTAIILPIALYLRLLQAVKNEKTQLISNIDKHLGATVKLIEVRNYYAETSAALKTMLDAAYKEGNRLRQDDIRKLINRLEALKVRTVDKQVRLLESGGQPTARKRRRSRKPRRRKNSSTQGADKPSNDKPNPQKNNHSRK